MAPEPRTPCPELVVHELRWFWEQLGAQADRRGDPDMATGTLTITAPTSPEERAAAIGVCGPGLRASQRRKIELTRLAELTDPCTPGEVAAAVLRRPLAARWLAAQSRQAQETQLAAALVAAVPDLGAAHLSALRKCGAIARLAKLSDPDQVIAQVGAVLRELPGGTEMVDRRVLAMAAGSPHGLDTGQPAATLCLSVLSALGRIDPSSSGRDAWASVGVVYDDITGGLSSVGIAPQGWCLPAGSPVTVPPKVLAECDWPTGLGEIVFVTENPSVLSAAVKIEGARVICTVGTPSRLEIAALGKLAASEWRLAVRADYDDAGITNTAAILAATSDATAWRMSAADYLAALEASGSVEPLRVERLGPTPWDPALREVMVDQGVAAYEEALLDDLLEDIVQAAEDRRRCTG